MVISGFFLANRGGNELQALVALGAPVGHQDFLQGQKIAQDQDGLQGVVQDLGGHCRVFFPSLIRFSTSPRPL